MSRGDPSGTRRGRRPHPAELPAPPAREPDAEPVEVEVHDGRRVEGEDGERVDVALVEDAEHDVDGHERGEDQEWLARKRGLEGLGGALEARADARGESDLARRALDGGDGVAEGDAGGEVEGEGDGRGRALVVDGEARRRRREASDGAERPLLSLRRPDVEVLR